MIEHFWEELTGPIWFNGHAIYREAVELAADGSVFVELGAWKGRSTSFMAVEIANSGKHIDFYTVDTWLGSKEERHHAKDPDVIAGALYDRFLLNIERVRSFVRPIRGLTTEVAKCFADESVDFVYVDAGHTEQAVYQDLVAWWPKLRQGGLLAGDDWVHEADSEAGYYPVRQAVQKFFAGPAAGHHIHLEEGFVHDYWTQWLVRKRPVQ